MPRCRIHSVSAAPTAVWCSAGSEPVCASGLKLEQAALDGVAHQPGDLVDVELLHDPVAVRLCGLEADVEKSRDRFGGLAFGNQLQDLALARRKRVLWLVAHVH